MSAHKLIPPALKMEIRLAEEYLQKKFETLRIENIPKDQLNKPILIVPVSDLKQAIGDTTIEHEQYELVLKAIKDMYEIVGRIVFQTKVGGLIFYLHDYPGDEHE